jgi:hypothetical protein
MATADKIQSNGVCDEDPFLKFTEIEQLSKIVIEILKKFTFDVEEWVPGNFATGDSLVFGYKDGPRWQLRLYNSGNREFTLRIYDCEFGIYATNNFNYDSDLLRQQILLFLSNLFD